MIDVEKLKTNGHARGARRVEGTGDLRPLADSLDTYARQIHSIAEIIRSIEEVSAEQSSEAKAAENTDGQQHLTSTLPAVGWRPLPAISDTLDRTPAIEAHAASIVDTISPEAIYQRVSGARKAVEARAIEWMPERYETRGSQRMRLMRETSSLIVALRSSRAHRPTGVSVPTKQPSAAQS
jgi:hypothetical protein